MCGLISLSCQRGGGKAREEERRNKLLAAHVLEVGGGANTMDGTLGR